MMRLQLLTAQKRMNRAGFTIMEVVIVVAFVALLAGVTFPRIADVQTRFAVRGAVTAFMSAHSLARATAIRQGGVAELHIDTTTASFWIEVDTTLTGSGVMDTVGFVVNLSQQRVTLSSTQALICFDGRGMPSSSSGCATTITEISFASENEADTIQVTALGKILR